MNIGDQAYMVEWSGQAFTVVVSTIKQIVTRTAVVSSEAGDDVNLSVDYLLDNNIWRQGSQVYSDKSDAINEATEQNKTRLANMKETLILVEQEIEHLERAILNPA